MPFIRFFPDNENTQRIVYYQGRRPLRALFFIILGYLIGWYAATHDTISRQNPVPMHADLPR